MELFSKRVDLNAVRTKRDFFAKAVVLVQVTPAFQKDVDVALFLVSIDPVAIYAFRKEILNQVSVCKVLIKNVGLYPDIPKSVLSNPEFIQYVYREAPHFAERYMIRLPRRGGEVRTPVQKAFTPQLLEDVMAKIRTGAYPVKMLKCVPVMHRRVYAFRKLRERDLFIDLLAVQPLNGLPLELKRHVADFLGLATSTRWLEVLRLIQRQIL